MDLQAPVLLMTFGINLDLFIKTIWAYLAIGATIFFAWAITIESNYYGEFIRHLLRALMTFFEGFKSLRKTNKENRSSGNASTGITYEGSMATNPG